MKVNPADCIPMDIFVRTEPVTIDLVYAQADHACNIFGEAIYRGNSRLWAHKDIAAITLLSARTINKEHNWSLRLHDCLRTSDAQIAMADTQIVKDHPEWCEGPFPLLSKPGMRGHPRAMAIDVSPINANDQLIDMGTVFDDMSAASARDYKKLSPESIANRTILENAFVKSAKALNLPMLPLPNEWWDFRFPNDYTEKYDPLSDADLPPQMQMTHNIDNGIPDFDDSHFEKLAESILAMIEPNNGNL